jgi:hypothetical protein
MAGACRNCGAPMPVGRGTCQYCGAEVERLHRRPLPEQIEPGVPVAADEFERALPSLVRDLEAALPDRAVKVEEDSGGLLQHRPYRIWLLSVRVGQHTFELTRNSEDEELVPTVRFGRQTEVVQKIPVSSHIDWLIELRKRLREHFSSGAAYEAIGSITSLLGEG